MDFKNNEICEKKILEIVMACSIFYNFSPLKTHCEKVTQARNYLFTFCEHMLEYDQMHPKDYTC